MPTGPEGAKRLRAIVSCNLDRGVSWIHSYVSTDRGISFCVYDAPSPEAIRRTARASELPVERIVEVSVLDPYAYEHIG